MNDIEIKSATKRFDEHLAIDNLSFQVPRGTIYGLLGPNGAGKTTTIRMITNILTPDSGEVTVLGQVPSPTLQRQIGYLPEERGLYRTMTIMDQLLFFARLKGLPRKEAKRRIEKWLGRFELLDWKKRKPHELSKGMLQKVQFIAATIHDPQLLILDEPFSGLDPIAVSALKEVIFNRKKRGKTIIFSTHQMEQAEQMCDELCVINRSKKVLGGTLREIKKRYGYNTVQLDCIGANEFLGDDLANDVKQFPSYMEIRLNNGVSAQEILKRVLAAGADVNRFELMEPSLNDIFIETVRGKNGTAINRVEA